MLAVQFVARSRSDYPLATRETCHRTWKVLRSRWPRVLSACLMGNHFHVLVEEVDLDEELAWLRRAIHHVAGWTGVDVSAQEARGRTKIRRDLRYIALNPCRAELAADPLEWLWSTHRELFGAVATPWVDRSRVLQLEGSPERHHAYVSADPSVRVQGTEPPQPPASATDFPIRGLGEIAAAARAATRGIEYRRRGPTRKMFLALARDQGWRDAALLARACGMTRQGVHHAWKQTVDVRSGRACLADPRLQLARVPTDPRT